MLTIAFVRGVMRARTEAGSSHGSVSPTTSANTGVAPVYAIAFAVATNVSEGTTTSSPAPSPAAIAIRCSAAVQFVTATACSAPVYSAKASSNSFARGPWLSQPERYTSATAAMSASVTTTSASGTRQRGTATAALRGP